MSGIGLKKLYDRECYGYKHDGDGKLIIDEEKVHNDNLIFELHYRNQSILGIIREFERRTIRSPIGKEKWCKRTIDVVLSSEE